MRIASLHIHNFRSFVDSGRIQLDQINVLIGPNNSGKSSVLRALHLIQSGGQPFQPELRINTNEARIIIEVTELKPGDPIPVDFEGDGIITATISAPTGLSLAFTGYSPRGHRSATMSQIHNIEPSHFIVPYFSKRKTAGYQEDVRSEYAMRIHSDLMFLAAKLSRLSNPEFPEHDQYRSTCKAILGFVVSTVPSANGQRPGAYLPDRKPIFIDQMGEGVPNIVGLLADLALSKGKLFLIEEPENDLHPQALKALLDLIIESSKHNQFVISTHSNIVVRHLASADRSALYSITRNEGTIPAEATITRVEPTVESRLQVLRDLGYSFSDFDLWDGWLILEESSAERIIRDYLIPWFAPKLTRVRTLAAGGITDVEPTFNDFHRLVRFTHLEEVYRNSTWVRVDGDKPGNNVINALRQKYSAWQPDRFACFGSSQFECYYPAIFSARTDATLSKADKQERREAKKQLLNEVRAWLDEDEARGKRALEESAAEVIADLKRIEAQLLDRSR